MYSLMVVDDEVFAVQGIARGIDWADINIDCIYECYSSQEAIKVFNENRIDVLISDIEMPEQNGLALLEWVKENSPLTETIFLTGYPEFGYAQRALQIGIYDYILKPVDHDILKERVISAIENQRNKSELEQFGKLYKEYYSLWKGQQPTIIERFWQQLLYNEKSFEANNLNETLALYEIPLNTSDKLLIILINIEGWEEVLNNKEKKVMEYGLRRIAEEIVLPDFSGNVIEGRDGKSIAILYIHDGKNVDLAILENRCQEFINRCNEDLKCELSCYIGEIVDFTNISKNFSALLELEQNNVTQFCSVVKQRDTSINYSSAFISPDFADWTLLFDAGKKEELKKRIEDYLKGLNGSLLTVDNIESFYYGFISMTYQIFHKKGCSLHESSCYKNITDSNQKPRSIQQLKIWSVYIVDNSIDYFNDHGKNSSAIIEKVQKYVQEHFSEEFNREDIAKYVYLNPVYLSRLFKKEQGISLMDYILEVRMNYAKRLLEETNIKIIQIAETVGYYNISHFAKMFKKVVGLVPQEYRKKFQIL